MTDYSKTPVNTAIFNITEAKRAPCQRSAKKLQAKVMLDVRQFAKELQKKKFIKKDINLDALSWDELCDHLAGIEEKSLVLKILGGITLGLAVGSVLAKTSHLRHPNGPAQSSHKGTRYAVQMLADLRMPADVKNLQDSISQQIVGNVTLPKVDAFIRNATLLDEQQNCTMDYEKMAVFLQNHVKNVRAQNKGLTASKDALGIRPGTHIFYTGAFTNKQKVLSHHGVYVGDGLVVDVGSIPTSCRIKTTRQANAKTMGIGLAFKAQGIGITNLAEFASRGADVSMMEYSKSKSASQVLKDLLTVVGPKPYNLVKDNCEHFATELVTGVKESHQIEEAKLGAEAIGLPILAMKFIQAYQTYRKVLKNRKLRVIPEETKQDIASLVKTASSRTAFQSANSRSMSSSHHAVFRSPLVSPTLQANARKIK